MAQNIYDHPVFFEGYSELRQNPLSVNEVLEQPVVRELLGDVTNKTIVELGSGAGALCRWLIAQGASQVTGVEISARMLELAGQEPSEGIEYRHQSLEEMELEQENYDFAVSSLVLHYIESLDTIARKVYNVLRPGGRFVFSIEHPWLTAISPKRWIEHPTTGRRVWPLERYREEGLRENHWMVEGVKTYHRTTETTVTTFLQAGFQLEALREPEALPEAVEQDPSLAIFRERPPFLILSWKKP